MVKLLYFFPQGWRHLSVSTSATSGSSTPSGFPARGVRATVSQYLPEREENHRRYLEILRRICQPHPVGKLTAASLAKAYLRFETLNPNPQLTITRSELYRCDCRLCSFHKSNTFTGTKCCTTPVIGRTLSAPTPVG